MVSLEAGMAAPQAPGGGKSEHPLLLSSSSLTSLTWIATSTSLSPLLRSSGADWCSCLSVLHLGTLGNT